MEVWRQILLKSEINYLKHIKLPIGYSWEAKATEIWNQTENWLTNYHVCKENYLLYFLSERYCLYAYSWSFWNMFTLKHHLNKFQANSLKWGKLNHIPFIILLTTHDKQGSNHRLSSQTFRAEKLVGHPMYRV